MAVAFFGDGAVNNGAFHEGLNMASIWKLPVLFVCENNQFATEVPFAYAAGNPSVASRGDSLWNARSRRRRQRRSCRLRGRRLGGSPCAARRRAHAARMPHLPHPASRRRHGRLLVPHPRRGRSLEDPLSDPPFKSCDHQGVASASSQFEAIESEIDTVVDDALQFAESSPWPDPSTATRFVSPNQRRRRRRRSPRLRHGRD